MDRKPRKQLPGVTARRRKGGAGGAPECGGFSRVPRIHTVRVRIYVFLLSPPAPMRNKMKRIKRMIPKKGATFLPERYYLSRSLQPPFSGNKHQHVIPSSGYLLSHSARALLACKKGRKNKRIRENPCQSVARERGAQAARSQADSAGERWGARVSKTR